MSSLRSSALLAAAMALSAVLVLPSAATSNLAAPATSTLVDIRAAHYPGYDRVVFEFEGPMPQRTRARWGTNLRLDPSGKPAHVQGGAFMRVVFHSAVAHDLDAPHGSTFGPGRRAFDLPNVAHVVLLGDDEGYLSFGIGLMKRTRILQTYRLTDPSRFVVHVATDFPKGTARVFFVDQAALVEGQPSYVVPVTRKVPRGRRAEAALQRLYAGPTRSERRAGLRFLASGTTGFGDLDINDRGIARVSVRGPCNSEGAAEGTVASQVMPTLRSRPAVDWIKIYDRDGQTLQPWGSRDSIPACLEP